VALFARFLRRPPVSSAPEPVAPPEPEPDPRAGELRRRIAESRELVDEREVFEEAETRVDQANPDARRQDVHVRGRAALERMRGEPDS